MSESLHIAEAVKEAARAEYKRKSRVDAAAAEAATAAAAAVQKRRRTCAAGGAGSDDEPPTLPPPSGDTEKYRRRLRMNQASAAAARHAQDVYVKHLEQLLTAQQAEKERIAEDAAAVAATQARLRERLSTVQQRLRDATPATAPLLPLSRASRREAARGTSAGAPPSRQSTTHRHRHRGPWGDRRPQPSAVGATASLGVEAGRGRTESHLGFGGSVHATYGAGGGCSFSAGLPPLSAAAAAVATIGGPAPNGPGWEAVGAGGSDDGVGGGGVRGSNSSSGGGNSGFSSFQAMTLLPKTADGAAGAPQPPLAALPPPAAPRISDGGALPPAETSHLGRPLDEQAEQEMLALESLLGRAPEPGGVALV